MHLLPQITVTAVLITDKTLHLRHSLVKNLVNSIWTWISYNVKCIKCTLISEVWYNTNADDTVLFNYCFFPPFYFLYINPPPSYPMVLWNAATEQRCTQMLFCCTGKLTQFPLYLLEGYEISFSPDVCFNGPGWPCSSEYGFCLWLLFEREREREMFLKAASLSPQSLQSVRWDNRAK